MRNKERWIAAGICAGLVALIWFVFGQTVRFPFINYDDPEYVYEVPEINQGLTVHGVNWAFARMPSPTWSPLTNISHMVVAQFYGINPSGYHLTNVVLHAITAILLALVLWQGTGSLWRSAFVAAVFAIHPLRVESVAWITERKDVLSGIFFMLTLGAYFFYARKPGVFRYLLVFVAHACGLLSKPMLVTTPVVLLLLDYWPLDRIQKSEVRSQWSVVRGLVVEKLPLLALSALSAWATIAIQTVAESSYLPPSLVLRIENAVVSVLIYIKQTLWPADLSVLYPHPGEHLNNWLFLIAAVFVVGITGVAIIVRRRRPYVAVGWFWYLVMLSPVLGIVQAGKQARADRFTYLPQIGLLIAVSWMVADCLTTPNAQRPKENAERGTLNWTVSVKRWALGVFCSAIILALALTARAQVSYWSDSELLWSHAIAVTKDNAVAHASLADLLLRRGRIDEAIEHCQETLKINPRDADAHNNLGLAFLQKGNEKDAAAEFKKSLEIDPNQMNAAPNLAWILATSPDPAMRNGAKAVELAESVLRHAGHPNAIVLRALAAAYAEAGLFADAVNAAEDALQLAKAQGNEGLAEDLQRAISNYRMERPLRSGVTPR
jgi:protein O-mannosyl-transferase